jgi:integrase
MGKRPCKCRGEQRVHLHWLQWSWWRGLRSEYMTTEAAWQTVKRYATACQLDHIKPHDFRRFVGTNLAKKDPRQAQKALGHRSIDTTYKHYMLDEMEVGLTGGLF